MRSSIFHPKRDFERHSIAQPRPTFPCAGPTTSTLEKVSDLTGSYSTLEELNRNINIDIDNCNLYRGMAHVPVGVEGGAGHVLLNNKIAR